ncbi:hypothetical protein, variant 2 [Exophiala xenobiotica]|uniref:RRM domain-containing protein n=1 Tax=Exophiala xenobiotica TaxID=348802 RepID=A0A0D2CN33_9EURO|nr:hypothetical protein, variant 2 [Exophiala xenobiotica]XP_013311892.1 hypothetical protein, variant 1 [Exophiala xenobiotica]KIW51307.1 hypothetical protein, variant 1 [Exophiala xenobiotica]KIW51308.1 hypothetical protein, variant 2 [Exophiala xenobiotica]
MPRERHRTGDSSKDEDQYIILVQDIPRHCRWQELKDMTRSLGGEQSLKAEVFETSDGSQLGHCTIKGRTAANQVYENFCVQGWNGQCVRVSLAVLEKPGVLKTLEGPKKSRGAFMETRIPPSLTYPGPQAVVTGIQPVSSRQISYPGSLRSATMTYNQQYDRMAPCTARPSVIYTHPAVNAPQMSPVHVGQIPYTYSTTTAYAVPRAGPVYPPSVTAARPSRINTQKPSGSAGAASGRINNGSTIFMSGLPPNQSEKQLRSLLKQYGPLVYLEIHPDGRNPAKAKGTARARYASSAEALSAVRGLDGAYLSKSKICVQQERADKIASLRPESKTTTLDSVAIQKKTDQIKPIQATSNLSQQVHPPRTSTDKGSTGSTSPTTGPLIVNGARGSRIRRSSRDAKSSGDDSSEGETEASDNSDDDSSEDETGTYHLRATLFTPRSLSLGRYCTKFCFNVRCWRG